MIIFTTFIHWYFFSDKWGYCMTKEDFNRAKEIREDIKILKRQTISAGLLAPTFDSWKDWVENTVEKLEEEFEKL